ncbi:MAG: MASE1 domain-containing protein, partial [Spongiibacteraceae bacterium]
MPLALQPAIALIESASQHPPLQRAGWAVLVALAYFLATQLGLAFTLQPQQVSTLWPPNAILLAALLLTRPSQWWLFLLAAFPSHLLAQLIQDVPLLLAVFWYFSNLTEVIIAAGLIKILLNGRCPRFDYFYDVGIFLVAGVLIAPFIASFIDIGAMKLLQGSPENFWMSWRLRFISGALSTLILVPVITISLSNPLQLFFFRRWFNALSALHVIELAVLIGGLLAVTGVAFLGPPLHYEIHSILLCTVLPFLLWSAVRFGPGLVNYLILGVALLGIGGVQLGLGSQAAISPAENVLMLQLFLIVTTVPILLMTAMICERRRAVHDARNSEEQLQTSLRAAHISSWMLDFSSNRISWIGAPLQLFGGSLASGITPAEMLGRVHVDDRERLRNALSDAIDTKKPFDLELRALDAAGNCCWFACRGSVCCDANGLPHHLMGIHIDITERKTETAQVLQLRQELTHLSRVAMLGELSGAVAHELNQPLTSILSNAQAALRLLDRDGVQKNDLAEILADIVAEDKR